MDDGVQVFAVEELGASVILDEFVHSVAVDELMDFRRNLRTLYTNQMTQIQIKSSPGN